MILRRAHVYRLYPTQEQASTLADWAGAVRCVYNIALEQRRTWWRPGRAINAATQAQDIKLLRAEFEWLGATPSVILHQAIRDLDRAYRNWWAGRARMPNFHKRGVNESMRFSHTDAFSLRRTSRHWGLLRISKLGWIRVRWDRPLSGEPKSLTVSRRAGIWSAAVQSEAEIAEPRQLTTPAIGIDRGVSVFAAVSDGLLIAPANVGKKAARALARAQRQMARKVRGSNNRRKARERVARLHARISRTRKDFLHKVSTRIAKSHGVVVLEKLEVRNMVRSAAGTVERPGRNVRAKAGLNRSILDQGWGMFRTMLAYKLEERGGSLVEVPPQFTSQTCAECGVVDPGSRRSQQFHCTACGHQAHADTNAAKNILQRARDARLLPVEGHRSKRPDEAGTDRRAA